MSSNKPLSLHLELKPSKRLKIYTAFISVVLLVCVLVMSYQLSQGFFTIIFELIVLYFLGAAVYVQFNEARHQYLHLQKPFPQVKYQDASSWCSIAITSATDMAEFVIIDYRPEGAQTKRTETLAVWKDAVQESDFRQLRALIKTGELYSID